MSTLSGKCIFVENIDDRITTNELHDIFAIAGEINSIYICDDPHFQGSLLSFIDFVEQDSVERCLEQLNGMSINSKRLIIGSFPIPFITMEMSHEQSVAKIQSIDPALIASYLELYITDIMLHPAPDHYKKSVLKEKLYCHVFVEHEEEAQDLTNILLEKNPRDIIHLLQDQTVFNAAIVEAGQRLKCNKGPSAGEDTIQK